MKEVLIALAGPLAKLLALALEDHHDEQAEEAAMLDLQRAIHNERARRKFNTEAKS